MDLASNEQNREPPDELQQLREENARLKALLNSHGIAWEVAFDKEPDSPTAESPPTANHLTTSEKIALFRLLFRGRTDVYPIRWQSAKDSAGYSPTCRSEWKPGICHKPKVKCGDCSQRLLLPVTDQVLFDHLSGKHTVGFFPLLQGLRVFLLSGEV
ncbi:hypothetical protein [uncultured Desulfobulbus sp.]|uniref:TOTE conflict system archaeo-eukaryotic primase domain-containing protein n=1 Tax=uncultured Desulfobulbus sp. TaxID=239745 RepID=UPI0029C7ED52|nr:hypothetical protein [uncultured Desulfobulbus sp.]